MKTVGVIGGLGPETTAEFYLDVVFSCQRQSQTARPGIIISSVPLPYQIEEDAIVRNQGIERFVDYLTIEAQRLEKAGSDFLVMPCNSLHVFISQIRNSVKIPVLSIVEETVNFVKQHNFSRIGIVSTSATIKNKIYETAFAQKQIEYVTPNAFDQAKLGQYIHHLVTGQQNNRDREGLIQIINSFEAEKVDSVVLACTDLQLLIPKHQTLKIFDTMKILVDATVREILS